ncbi:helix-turn-helix domain-containing protein [Larkinella terrae]|uniref:Helix-turn-helix domain-containing protein n=1 Tax=Larkinella terrae TaxID=2025311 RepID=A0A7K0ETU8_9BACT|nr:helix-turn-helix domain-containing protein [Larkinella terrae]MRS65234.1 helix-turn-helix domain-containing protein [Larkinella terrae]
MKNITGLTPAEIKELHYYIDQKKNTAIQKRCQCILYSYYGMQVSDLMKFFEVDRRSIYNWLHRWEKGKIQGLMDKPGRGLKPKLSLVHQDQVECIKEALCIHPEDRCQRLERINTLLPKPVSYDTLRRFEIKLRSIGV